MYVIMESSSLGKVWSSANYLVQFLKLVISATYTSFSGHCYKLIARGMDFWDAKTTCVNAGMNLAVITTEEETTFVRDFTG